MVLSELLGRGLSREYIFNYLDEGCITRLIFYPRDDKGALIPSSHSPAMQEYANTPDPWMKIRELLVDRGWSESAIETYIQKEKERHITEGRDAAKHDINNPPPGAGSTMTFDPDKGWIPINGFSTSTNEEKKVPTPKEVRRAKRRGRREQ